MRLTPIAPADLTPEQRPLYDDMREGIAKSFKGFVAIRDDGALAWAMEPLAARTFFRQGELGPCQGAGGQAFAAEVGTGSRDRHRCSRRTAPRRSDARRGDCL